MHGIARMSVEWMLYCLLEGTLLALFAWVLLRLLPRQNAGTRFALWFAVLLATMLLPLAAGTQFRTPGKGAAGGFSLLTIPDSLAIGIFAAWALAAAVALLRVIAGFCHVNRIRRNSEDVGLGNLNPQLKAAMESFGRPATLRISDCVQVPAAIGFWCPAVVIPRWFLEEMSPGELEQVVLHELTHLRRRDDWTNLAQKIIKAVLFFHPLVWWIEQRLSLEREMACDDAVLAHSPSPQHYAECLARLAEKSVIKKRISLAQAIVGRMRQLSLRVARILDTDRPSGTRIWKPAIPMVMAAATLCGFSAWSAPALVSFQDAPSAPSSIASSSALSLTRGAVQAVPVSSSEVIQPEVVLARASLDRPPAQQEKSRFSNFASLRAGMTKQRKSRVNPSTSFRARLTKNEIAKNPDGNEFALLGMNAASKPEVYGNHAQHTAPNGDFVVQAEQVVVATNGRQMWQVRMWQIVFVSSAAQDNKAVSRKKI